MADNDHELYFETEFDRTVTHPDNDPADCDFEAYIDRDWTRAALGLGRYGFTKVAGTPEQPDGYWNGTYFG